jgi:hypothetical protein
MRSLFMYGFEYSVRDIQNAVFANACSQFVLSSERRISVGKSPAQEGLLPTSLTKELEEDRLRRSRCSDRSNDLRYR